MAAGCFTEFILRCIELVLEDAADLIYAVCILDGTGDHVIHVLHHLLHRSVLSLRNFSLLQVVVKRLDTVDEVV